MGKISIDQAIEWNRVENTYGIRTNTGKPRFSLFPTNVIWKVIDVFEWGAVNRGKDNWKKGFPFLDIYDSMQRHLKAWREGEDIDEQTKCYHLAQLIWNATVALYFTLIGRKDLDNRNE